MASVNGARSALSPTSASSPVDRRSRRDSTTSISVSSQVDKEQMAQALDKIHTSASQSGILTTFNDFASPPGGAPPTESKGTAGDIVQQGLSGLYSRFKEAVGVAGKGATQETDDLDIPDAASRKSANSGHTASKASISSLARGESGATASTSTSALSGDATIPAASSAGTPTTEGRLQSSKAPSISISGSKSTSSSTQNLPRIAKTAVPSIVDPAVVPITVSAFRDNESIRGVTLRTDEGRSHSRRSTGKLPDIPQNAVAPGNSAIYDGSSRRNPSTGDRIVIPSRSRRDESMSLDGSIDLPLSPGDGSNSATGSGQRLSSRETLRKPAVIDRISQSGSSGQLRSRSSSIDTRTAEPSPINMSAHSTVYHESFTHDEKPEQLRSGAMRITGTTTNEGAPAMVNARLEVMRKQVLSKEFWMADETCKECFLCGDPFSAFRRKHHCRTCGCIFDGKCTSTIPGQKFGVSGTLRVCKTCLNIINRRYDSGSDDSGEDDSYLPAIFRPKPLRTAQLALKSRAEDELSLSERTEDVDDNRSITTPMMAIPATRRMGESNRHSAVLEIDAPQLSRPSSSRSLRSLAGRPQSSGHKRHHSKHNFLGRFKTAPEDSAPFRKSADEELRKKSKLPAFHDDNIIDPELAAYMSEESSGDEQMSIFATMASSDIVPSSLDPEKSNFGPFLNAGRKHRFRQGEKSVSGLSFTSRGVDDLNLPSAINHGRPSRRRNMSTTSASGHHLRSPRPKSAVFKGANDNLSLFDNSSAIEATRLTRSDSIRDEKPPETELSAPSLSHVKKLLRQLLQEAGIPNTPAWEKALVPILIRCSNDLDPDAQRGDVMDVRHYVKLKRIPGGKPGDTSYVSGVIFTKNLALKSMPRRILNPRIIIVSFPIEYQRQQQQHFMSLQPVIEQEKEFLRVVVNRIIALRPQVLLCEKSVAGVALQYLSEAGISVVYNVKQTVIEAVSRCAETEIISSLDMLALKIPVGLAGGFEVKTYVNNDFPGRKKTYIFISGCNEKLGCTIALRGATTDLLSHLKTITEFMVYVVYNLKLESCLLRDQWINVPATIDGATTPSTQPTEDSAKSVNGSDQGATPAATTAPSQNSEVDKDSQPADAPSSTADENQIQEQASLSSVSRSKTLVSLHESHSKASHDTQVPEDVPMPTFYSDMVAKYETKILSASPFVKFMQPYLLMKSREQERRLVYLKRLRDQDIFEDQGENEKAKPQPFQLIKPEMVHEIGQKAPRQIMEVLHAVHDAEYDKALYNYQTQTRQWENYIQGNLDLFDPYSHQNIVVLYSVICTETKIPCTEPSLIAIGFYQEGPTDSMDPDITLGQYIEDLCDSSENICHANGCDRQMCAHHRTYVHDEARITIFVEKSAPIPMAVDDTKAEEIYMWSYCKECKRDMGFMVMSDATWKYSFGKYLELSFWSRGLKMHHEMNCPHDYQKEHIRYFWHGGTSVRLHYDPIDLLEIIVPRARITWKVDHDLRLKNEIFTKSEDRWNRYMNSVRARLKSIRIDSVLPDKAEACKSEVDRLTKKAQEDQASLISNLQGAYMNSKYYEVIPLNAIIRGMLEKVADWDSAFTKFEADFLSDKDVRQLTIIQLKKMFTDNESKESLPTTTTDGTSITSTDTEDKTTPHTTQTSVSDPDEKTPSQPSESEASLAPVPIITTTDDALSSPSKTLISEPLSERVEPLDLATPSSPTLHKSGLVPPDPNKAPNPDALMTPSPLLLPTTQATPVAPPLNTSLSLTEKVEQLRRQHQAMTAELGNVTANLDSNLEPPRAIPERGSSRRAGMNVSPPMIRAISTPAGTLPRTHATLVKPLLGKESKIPEPGELHRVPTNESSKSDKKLSERFGLGALKTKKAGQSSIPRYVHGKKRESKVSTLARHFEQLSREFEKERLRDRKQRAAKMHNSRAFLPRSSTKAIVEVYEDVDQAVLEPGPSDDDPKTAGPNTTTEGGEMQPADASGTLKDTATSTEAPSQNDDGAGDGETDDQKHESHAGSDEEAGGSDADQSLLEEILPDVQEIADSLESSEEIPLELPKHQKSSLMKMLSNFWAERSASWWTPLEYPLNATDHIFIDSDVIVREDEPSSLIAFALSSEDYQAKLADIRHQWKMSNQRDVEDSADGETKSIANSESGDGLVNGEELEKSLLRTTGTHLKYQFVEGSAKMLCKIFYAEQFDALRRKCGVADRIIESLSRCLKWDSKGGKTKSVFLKTLDDRLVMKSLSPIETAAFLRFAPAYFSIMSEALFHDLPSVIAKMLGFFQVSIKNPVTNTEIKLDLLVMENLFYDRSPNRIFDLKGSMRNRKIQSTGEQNEVLLDENMVEYIYESPLFAREHSKKLLRASVWNDTLFLARQNVMDYSLMIAVDEAKKELVVGIIDCIRTYTWDKRLESWIKDRGFAGGGRNRPTVTSPKEYKSRFREAMARYILQAPNCWHQFGVPQGAITRARFEGDVRND